MEKLIKAWGSHPPGTLVTTDLADVKTDGAVRVGVKRLEALRAGGYLASGAAQAEAMAEPGRPLRGRTPRGGFQPFAEPGLPPAAVDVAPGLTPLEQMGPSFVPALSDPEPAADPAVFEKLPDPEKTEE